MNTRDFQIKGRIINKINPPFIIAEMSANHNGSIENAKKVIQMAKRCGADAVKMQSYTPDTITLNSDNADFQIQSGLWEGKNLYELYEQAHTPFEWHFELFEFAKSIGIMLFSSPFDETAVDLLENLNTPAYKIASFEVVDLPLIERVAQTKKPLIMSTGMASEEEIGEALEVARTSGCTDVLLLHCVSGYPAPEDEYNLRTVIDLENKFKVPIGLSDHTLTNTTSIAAVALGAVAIEKHVTLDRTGGGPDDCFSLEEAELRHLCVETKIAWSSLGAVNYSHTDSEKHNIKFRRSLYFVKDLVPGHIIGIDDVKSVRPGFGISPKYRDSLIGKTVKRRIRKNTRVEMSDLEE